MKMKYFLLLWGAALPLLLQCSACYLNVQPNNVSMDIVWNTPVTPEGQISMAFDGNIAYRDETDNGGFVALNMDTGNVIYRVSNVAYAAANSLIVNGSIYLYDEINPMIWEFTKQGQVVRKIWVTSGSGKPVVPPGYFDPYRPRMYSWSGNGTKLYWGASNGYKDANYGVETINVDTDPIPTGNPNEYWVKPTTIYSDLGFNLSCEYLFDSGVMYIGAWKQDWDKTTYNGYLVAISLTDYSLLWKSNTTNWQYGRKTLHKYNGRIIAAAYALESFDPSNGNRDYENLLAGFGNAGGTISGGYIYASNMSCDSPPENGIYNIQCLDLVTGNMIWHAHDPTQSLGQNPIVYQGICYVPTQIDVKLFNAETGAYLGYATNITGDGNFSNSNYLWAYDGDTWMIINGSNFVAAVRLNFRIDSSGKLYKVN
jgi:hypothetical protein